MSHDLGDTSESDTQGMAMAVELFASEALVVSAVRLVFPSVVSIDRYARILTTPIRTIQLSDPCTLPHFRAARQISNTG